MLHQTHGETSPNLYESTDGLVSVRVLDEPHRYPKHDYKVVVFRLTPKAHSRVRYLSNGAIEFLPANEELQKFVQKFDALLRANGKPPLTSGTPLLNKPEERRQRWNSRNSEAFGRPGSHTYKKRRFIRRSRYVANYRNN
jgi:hypothetical protein